MEREGGKWIYLDESPVQEKPLSAGDVSSGRQESSSPQM